MPFFATGNAPNFSDSVNPEYGTGGVNNRDIEIQQGDEQWAYFGCFLNVYDPSFTVNGTRVQELLAGDHHCLVAQIAYAGARSRTPTGSPCPRRISDKLAQRNLQVTHLRQPGQPRRRTASRRPSTCVRARSSRSIPAVPDELMINWGRRPGWEHGQDLLAAGRRRRGGRPQPRGCTACSCCRSRNARDRVRHEQEPDVRADSRAAGPGFAGLLTIQLPATVVKGQEFNVLVRRISTRSVQLPPPNRSSRRARRRPTR